MTNENVFPAPTVVIGVGEAGIKAMAALYELVDNGWVCYESRTLTQPYLSNYD